MTNVGFEGVVGRNAIGDVPAGYAGLQWSGVLAMGDKYINKNDLGGTGFGHALHKNAVGFLDSIDGAANGEFFLEEGTFTLRSGIFAAAYDPHLSITFVARLNGHLEGTKTVEIGTDATTIKFGRHFHHIDSIEIQVDASGDNSAWTAIDNLTIVFDALAADSAVTHALPHISDWPLA